MSWTKAAASTVRAARRVEALEIADFAFAEDEDARRLQIVVETGQGEAGLLDVRAGDGALEAGGAAEELERKAESLRAGF